MLATGMEILSKARKEGYGVGAFNVNNMEFVQAVLEAAEEVRSPVLLALSEGAIKYGGKALATLVRELGRDASVPVCIHLDHGSSYESCLRAIQMGFTSVMIDKSHEDTETNIRETKRVVEAAHAVGVTVEAEIGRLGGVEEHVAVSAEEAFLTNPEEAKMFMDATGADYLAVAIGTSHGAYKGKGRPFIDHERIKAIAAAIPNPLVMHGASSVPQSLVDAFRAAGGEIGEAAGIHPEDIQKGIKAGIAKINTDTDLRLGFVAKIRQILKDNPKEFDPRKFLGPAREELKQIVKARMELFGSAGKA
ncbi:MAG: class II fructose-1,6-bisphosphate aldolase [Deinococcota bacterium]|uniref:Fructose-1,6-bisphosphate aldolase, class II n=1 Tax=Allomeiothermus silvanus (strain ATCC 700542 / DSM 9946 / NBRC 106475 / NCIMB 13440 / VI-R2) TaxID=526227 RepID=D7BBB2_ALLS1|nr:class II fructose-1,6-bisphosphate aldolase [Allomeiothermus silvanus]ADH62672.1 fructose-1,6-bisphosphate aldolase, class II [Allomeiothermus silvanus DSM 9946]MBI5813263.1 class II fructose-1,6-bisphosphate aldolase [Allomeiothermus silvanus]